METIRLFMKGRGADDRPGFRAAQRRARRQGQQCDEGEHRQHAVERVPQAARLRLAQHALRGVGPFALVVAETWLHDVVVDQADQQHQHGHRGDREPDIRREVDGAVRVQEVDGVVGDLGQDRIRRHDHDIHQEGRRDRGEAEREAGKRMPPDADIGRGGQRDQHQVAGIGGDGGDDADKGEDVGQRSARRRADQLLDQGPHQPRFFGYPDAEHCGDDDADRVEGHEVGDNAGEHEPHAVQRQQAARQCRPRQHFVRLRVDHLVGDA
jgi:hypothetical protein